MRRARRARPTGIFSVLLFDFISHGAVPKRRVGVLLGFHPEAARRVEQILT